MGFLPAQSLIINKNYESKLEDFLNFAITYFNFVSVIQILYLFAAEYCNYLLIINDNSHYVYSTDCKQ